MNSTEQFNNDINQQKAAGEKLSTTKIPVVEERLRVGVKQVETGSVQIHKKIISQEVSQKVLVNQDEITVEHVPVNQYVDVAPAIRYEGDSTIISVVKEVLVVEKRLMLVEELYISKKQVISTATVKETLRKEEVEINRINASNNLLNQ